MEEGQIETKSPLELIVEKFLANLAEHQEFDPETLAQISKLAADGELANSTKVGNAVSAKKGEAE